MKICSRCIRGIKKTEDELYAKRESGICDLCNEGDIVVELFDTKPVEEAEGLLGNRRHGSRNSKREIVEQKILQSVLANHMKRESI